MKDFVAPTNPRNVIDDFKLIYINKQKRCSNLGGAFQAPDTLSEAVEKKHSVWQMGDRIRKKLRFVSFLKQLVLGDFANENGNPAKVIGNHLGTDSRTVPPPAVGHVERIGVF